MRTCGSRRSTQPEPERTASRRPPTGVAEGPDHVRRPARQSRRVIKTVSAVEARDQAVPALAGDPHALVVRRRRPPLVFGVQVGGGGPVDRDEAACHQAGRPLRRAGWSSSKYSRNRSCRSYRRAVEQPGEVRRAPRRRSRSPTDQGTLPVEAARPLRSGPRRRASGRRRGRPSYNEARHALEGVVRVHAANPPDGASLSVRTANRIAEHRRPCPRFSPNEQIGPRPLRTATGRRPPTPGASRPDKPDSRVRPPHSMRAGHAPATCKIAGIA